MCVMSLLHVRIADGSASRQKAFLTIYEDLTSVLAALSGRATLRLQPTAGLDPNMRLGSFLEVLERETGLRAKDIDILTGYPPAPVRIPHDPDSLLSCLAISNGDTLLIRRQETTSVAASEPTAVTSKLARNSPASEGTQVQGSSHGSRACRAQYMHSLGSVCTSPSQATPRP